MEKGIDLMHRDSFCNHMQNSAFLAKPNSLGIGYTKDEVQTLITRLHGSDVPKTRTKMLTHPESADFLKGEQKELETFQKWGFMR